MKARGAPAGDEAVETAAEVRTIEDLAAALNVPDWLLAGAKVHYGWGAGKEMTLEQFAKDIDRFLKSPVGGDPK